MLAFLLMGLQARIILSRHAGDELWRALIFASVVLAIVILVRLGWVMIYGAVVRWLRPPNTAAPTKSIGLLVSWCDMRGLVTLATAYALPQVFPGRDVIVLSAFIVALAKDRCDPQANTEHDRLRMSAIAAQRKALAEIRAAGRIDDDAFHRLEEELDWAELNVAPPRHSSC